MPTSASLIAAARDADLTARIIALGRAARHTEQDVRDAIPVLVGKPADNATATIASVYEYTVATYDPTPRPGENPAAVTDEHIMHALGQMFPG